VYCDEFNILFVVVVVVACNVDVFRQHRSEIFWRTHKAQNGLMFFCLLGTFASFSCSWTYFTRTMHLVLAYLAALIPLVEVYSIIDVYVFVVSWSSRLSSYCWILQ